MRGVLINGTIYHWEDFENLIEQWRTENPTKMILSGVRFKNELFSDLYKDEDFKNYLYLKCSFHRLFSKIESNHPPSLVNEMIEFVNGYHQLKYFMKPIEISLFIWIDFLANYGLYVKSYFRNYLLKFECLRDAKEDRWVRVKNRIYILRMYLVHVFDILSRKLQKCKRI